MSRSFAFRCGHKQVIYFNRFNASTSRTLSPHRSKTASWACRAVTMGVGVSVASGWAGWPASVPRGHCCTRLGCNSVRVSAGCPLLLIVRLQRADVFSGDRFRGFCGGRSEREKGKSDEHEQEDPRSCASRSCFRVAAVFLRRQSDRVFSIWGTYFPMVMNMEYRGRVDARASGFGFCRNPKGFSERNIKLMAQVAHEYPDALAPSSGLRAGVQAVDRQFHFLPVAQEMGAEELQAAREA
jgi:hypothetical protein